VDCDELCVCCGSCDDDDDDDESVRVDCCDDVCVLLFFFNTLSLLLHSTFVIRPSPTTNATSGEMSGDTIRQSWLSLRISPMSPF